jgi:hypothetical protein
MADIDTIKAPHYYDNAGFCNHCGIWEQQAPEFCELVTLKEHVAALTAAVKRAKIDAVIELLGGISIEEHDHRIITKNYEQGKNDERTKHHADSCCRVCNTHVNPHRGCILR